jgi:hypothetical protein
MGELEVILSERLRERFLYKNTRLTENSLPIDPELVKNSPPGRLFWYDYEVIVINSLFSPQVACRAI